jgi:hypothetical protein
MQLSSVLSRLGNEESSLSELSQSAIKVQTLIETNKTLVDKVVSLTSELKKSQQKTARLAKKLEDLARTVAMGSSISAVTTTRSATSPAVHAGVKQMDKYNDLIKNILMNFKPIRQIKMNGSVLLTDLW